MISTIEDFREILNLKTSDSIGEELAERQLKVITKSYQFLRKPENNIIYLADEVGLGKTYMAAGIAMLFHHFSSNPSAHKDLIIVPKKNLQSKWQKDLSNFCRNNYLYNNDQLKAHYTFEGALKERIGLLNEDPLSIIRMTSFSALGSGRNSLEELMVIYSNGVFYENECAKNILRRAVEEKVYNYRDFRNLLAYLFNAFSSKINCLIIDEAHNYKYGPGNQENEQSIRNETTARYLGAYKDKKIFMDFPELEKMVKFPLAHKTICLSATPKDRSLFELRNQFDCFSSKHIFSESETEEDIEKKLSKILIRGNLEYRLKNVKISRNRCQHEHRKGNVKKEELSTPLKLEDNFDSVFWQLIQYKSIKHLQQKINPSFEMGMLAGFETYRADLNTRLKNKQSDSESEEGTDSLSEYEYTEHRKIKTSQDADIINNLVQSYENEFKEFPPHPKQSYLEEEILEQVRKQEKSLIFVRRISTAYELHKRFNNKFEKEVVVNEQLSFVQKHSEFKSQDISDLIKDYQEKEVNQKLTEVFLKLLDHKKIKPFCLKSLEMLPGDYVEEGCIWLNIAFNFSKNLRFKALLKDHILRDLTNISRKLRKETIKALKNSQEEYLKVSSDQEKIDEEEEEDSGYFFLDFFKRGSTGFSYKKKLYKEFWFDINPIQLNQKFQFASILEKENLQNEINNLKIKDTSTKRREYLDKMEICYRYLWKKSPDGQITNEGDEILEGSFITSFLTHHCTFEMEQWFAVRRTKEINALLKDIRILNYILINIFRNGSALLPGYIIENSGSEFSEGLSDLITRKDSPFNFILNEIKTIINDFDLIVQSNFDDKSENSINKVLRNLTPVVGTTGQDKIDRGILAAKFRMPGYPYVLITTDILREGEDLHTYCQNVYHYGIAWNPSDMQQRTGRVDRINSLSYRKLNASQKLCFENKVNVFYPYLSHSVEVNQVMQLFKNVDKFTKTFNNIAETQHFESNITIGDEITEEGIPQPVTENLISKYDIHSFKV